MSNFLADFFNAETIFLCDTMQPKPKSIAKKLVPPSSVTTDTRSSRSVPAPSPASHGAGPQKGGKTPGAGGGGAVDDITGEPVGADDYKTKLQMQRKLAREKAQKDAEEEQQKKELKE